jgi:predicted alpha/beta hydrolase
MRDDEVRRIIGDEAFEDAMVAVATSCSSRTMRLLAEIALRKMYPSKHPRVRGIAQQQPASRNQEEAKEKEEA